MRLSNILRLPVLHLSLASLSQASVSPRIQQAPLTLDAHNTAFTFRNGTLDDIDDMVTVFVDAFGRSDLWEYLYQFRDEVDPLYTWSCQRKSFLTMWKRHPQLYFKVLTVPDGASKYGQKVVSISAWDFSMLKNSPLASPSVPWINPLGLFSATYGPPDQAPTEGAQFDCDAHLDTNMTRARHFSKWSEAAERDYIRDRPGRHLCLALLATHPSWDGHGFAAQHLHWGKAQLEKLGSQNGHLPPLTLIASPAGYPLYVSEGFEGLANLTLDRLDGKGKLWMEAMQYDHKV